MRISLPKRSTRYGVGKEIGGAVYLHRSYEALLGSVIDRAKRKIPTTFDYVVVKYNLRTGHVSFIACPDFDWSPEPELGDIWTVSQEGPPKHTPRPKDPYIYHHKWLMVSEDYTEFDVDASRERSRHWLSLPSIDKSRIGRKSYWQAQVLDKGSLPPES